MLRKRVGTVAVATLAGLGLSVAGFAPAQAAVTDPTLYGPLPGSLSFWKTTANLVEALIPETIPQGITTAPDAHQSAHISISQPGAADERTITVGDCEVSDLNVRYAVGELDDVEWDMGISADWRSKDPAASLNLTGDDLLGLVSDVVTSGMLTLHGGAFLPADLVYGFDLTFGADSSITFTPALSTDISGSQWDASRWLINNVVTPMLDDIAEELLNDQIRDAIADTTFSVPVDDIATALDTALPGLSLPTINLGDFSYAYDFGGQLTDGQSYTISPADVISNTWMKYLNANYTTTDGFLSSITLEGLLGTDVYNAVKQGVISATGSWPTDLDTLSGTLTLALGSLVQSGALDSLFQGYINSVVSDVMAAVTPLSLTNDFGFPVGTVGLTFNLNPSFGEQLSDNAMALVHAKLGAGQSSWLRTILDNLGGTFTLASSLQGMIGTIEPTGVVETPVTAPATVTDHFLGEPGDAWTAASYPRAGIDQVVISDPEVASYDPATGTITALKAGTTQITLNASLVCSVDPSRTISWTLASYTVEVADEVVPTNLPTTGAMGDTTSPAPFVAGGLGLALVGAGVMALRRRADLAEPLA